MRQMLYFLNTKFTNITESQLTPFFRKEIKNKSVKFRHFYNAGDDLSKENKNFLNIIFYPYVL